jgi:plasmid stabilization system protein ParE
MTRHRLSPLAKQDLREIAAYIAQFDAEAAHRWTGRLKEVCRETLALAPGLGTRCDELLPGMRCYSVGNYVIFFRDRNPVEILRIVNGNRDFNQLQFVE